MIEHWNRLCCGVCTLGGAPNLTAYGRGQLALVYPALNSGGWSWQSPEVTSNLSCYMILWNDQTKRHFLLQFCLSNCWVFFTAGGSAVGHKWLIDLWWIWQSFQKASLLEGTKKMFFFLTNFRVIWVFWLFFFKGERMGKFCVTPTF